MDNNNIMNTDDYHNIIKNVIGRLIINLDNITRGQLIDTSCRVNALIYKMAFPNSDFVVDEEEVINEDVTNNEYYIRINEILETLNWQLFAGGLTDDETKNLINIAMSSVDEVILNINL
jgi:hypothetical protein